MALTYSDYKAVVKHALYGEPAATFTDADTTKGQVVNEAGRHMVNSHPWEWRSRPPVPVSVQANAKSVPLPADFGELVPPVTTDDTLNVSVRMTTVAQIYRMRNATTTSSSGYYWAAVNYPQSTADNKNMPTPRLEIYPDGRSGDTFHVEYRAGWRELTRDTDVPDIPLAFESLLRLYCEAFAKQFNDELFDAIDAVESGSVFQRMVEMDSRGQTFYGPITGGWIAQSASEFAFTHDGVADPS